MNGRARGVTVLLSALLALPAAGRADEAEAGLIERAASALAESPYSFDFELTGTAAEGGERHMRGSARVLPLADGTSRYRIEASRTGPDGSTSRFVAADDGETVRVLDESAGRLWFTPRYRAGVFLSGEYLGSLLPLALSSSGLRRSAGYRSEPGEPVQMNGRACDTVRLPLPRGAWVLSFDHEDGTPCRYELVTGEGESAVRVVLTFGRFERQEAAAPFELQVPARFDEKEFTPGGPAPGDPAPAMTVTLPGGGDWSLAEQRWRVVVLDFWATWCVPCRSSMKATQTLLDERPDQPLVALGPNVMDSGDREAFYRDLGVSYPWAVADGVADDWGIDQTGLPALFVVGKDGRVVDYFLGALSEEHEARLAATVDRALAE